MFIKFLCPQIDELFQGTVSLNGKQFQIFSRRPQLVGNKECFVYSCHLCRIDNLGSEQDLLRHVNEHFNLLKLPMIPLKERSEKAIVAEKAEKPRAFGCANCSNLKNSMCGMHSEVAKASAVIFIPEPPNGRKRSRGKNDDEKEKSKNSRREERKSRSRVRRSR